MSQRNLLFKLMFFACFLGTTIQSDAQILAFPGAEGFGKYAKGGRTGTVYHVTNLNDTGTGSLRDAVSKPNRIVVFDVAGVIRINDRMVVSANIYIAGQTAPGEGITVYGNGWSFSNANNTICRYLKMRMGVVGTSGKDACGIADGNDMIFDHCSISWGRDENFSINATNAERITLQNNIISQGILVHSAGGLIQTDGGVTLYRNLYANNGTRNNKIKGVNQYVNNLVYNWDAGAYIMGGDSEGQSFANAVGNCFIQGPVLGTRPFSVGNSLYHIYAEDNIHDNNQNGIFDGYQIPQSEFGGGPDFQTVPYNYPILPTVPANTLLTDLLPNVGASLPCRDLVDYYVVNEVKSLGKSGKFLSNENELPFGVPTSWALWGGTTRLDSDNDGMPDEWENNNGLNPNLASDAMVIAPNGYTNIENYINGINSAYSQYYLRAPLKLKTDSASQTSVSISWYDYTENEQGYIIEKKVGSTFTEIGRTAKDVNYFTISGMTPEQTETIRVKAFDLSSISLPTNELVIKSKPIPVSVLDLATYTPDLTWTGNANATWDKTSNNWINNANSLAFSDNSSVMFNTAPSAQSISFQEPLIINNAVISSASDYTFQGTGSINGTGSVNKTGAGKLSLLTNNSYTGATVLWDGTMEINKLANGGLTSSIGASSNYGFNWVWKGGKINYTGGDVSTDRSVTIDGNTEFSVGGTAIVTMTGVIAGSGGLIKNGTGKLILKSVNPYEGETVIKGGIVEVQGTALIEGGVALGTSNVLRLQGGTYRTTSGSTTVNEVYPMNIIVENGYSSGFEPFRNAGINATVSGNGTLTYAITYSRELIQGDWSQFSGTLIAKGVGTLTGAERSMLMLNNSDGIPNARIETAGNTKIACYKNAVTMHLGGLSGPTTTCLSGANKTAGGSMTWIVGGAGTDETFNGQINNEAYSSGNGTTTIVKEGSGIWRLTGANVYSGTTTVNDGTLIVNGVHSGSGKITVTGGTLAGKGTLKGDVEIQADASIQPGDASISTLTLQGKLTLLAGSITEIDVNKTNSTWDKFAITGTLGLNGTLKVNLTGTVAIGNVFKIFTSGTATGNFSSIEPASPGSGMAWEFTPATGELKVVAEILPVKLISFSAKAEGKQVRLFWNTASEQNNSHFEIERSVNGIDFKPLLKVQGNLSISSVSNYIAYDPSPANGTNYYKLVQYDIDGNRHDEGVKSVKFSISGSQLIVYPNPISNYFTVKLPVDYKGVLFGELRSLDGKLAAKLSSSGDGGQFSFNLEKEGLASGVYILNLSGGAFQESIRIIIK